MRFMPLPIAHLYYHPLAVSILQRIRHGHPVVEVLIILRMKGHSRVRKILVERH